MTLIEGEKDGVYRILQMNVESQVFAMRLKSIGVSSGASVKVISSKKRGGLIIQSGRKQIALCRNVASGIVVEYVRRDYPEVI